MLLYSIFGKYYGVDIDWPVADSAHSKAIFGEIITNWDKTLLVELFVQNTEF